MRDNSEDPGQRSVQSGHSQPALLSADQFYRCLSSEHRRRLLYYLLDTEESTLEELATVLSGWEATDTGRMKTPTERDQIRLGLHHNHLPLLSESGLVAYDPEDGTVRAESLHPRVADIVRWSIESEQ